MRGWKGFVRAAGRAYWEFPTLDSAISITFLLPFRVTNVLSADNTSFIAFISFLLIADDRNKAIEWLFLDSIGVLALRSAVWRNPQ